MSVVGWTGLTVAATTAALLVPLAPTIGEDLRVAVCRSTSGSCGYRPATVRCRVLSRDFGVASALTPLTEVRSGAEPITTTKFLDGGAEVAVREPPGGDRTARLGLLAERRLARSGSPGVSARPGPDTGTGLVGDGLVGAVWTFPRHDDADAWRDRYLLAAAPVTSAVAGTNGSGVHRGVSAAVRSVGFDDPDSVREPDGVVIGVGAQSLGGDVYSRASVGRSGAEPASRPTRGATLTSLTVDATGRASTFGPLPLAPTTAEASGSLATRLGLGPDAAAGEGSADDPGPATYLVRSDASGRPATLMVSGTASRTSGGSFRASAELPRIREQGESLGAAGSAVADAEQGIRTRQTIFLDLRGETNQRAFTRVFLAGGGLTVPRAARPVPTGAGRKGRLRMATDRPGQREAVTALVRRISKDAVFVRTRVRTGPQLAAASSTAASAAPTEAATLQGFSQDFAVPTSRLTRMPGCSR